ncbi:MAG TPA: dockerin type I domain-containing protein, partial [Tepidisphaeraceae bacterium]|nr:dockerin type I domain-containing protein [Tepidisphaeraceae bacterium]
APTLSADGRTMVVTFTGSSVIGGSLADGTYTLNVRAAGITGAAGVPLWGGDRALAFHRRLGDANGDGRTDMADNRLFTAALGSRVGSTAYRWYFDFNNDGKINMADNRLFTSRLGVAF